MSFFKKLNHLVQSHINDLIDGSPDEHQSRARRKFLSRHDVGEDLQKDAKMLRERVNDALGYQDQLQAKIDKLYKTLEEWDAKADAAVDAGRDTDARFAIGRVQQTQREIDIAESALREHQLVAQELISQVNSLEAVLEQAQREALEKAQMEKAQRASQPEEGGAYKIDVDMRDEGTDEDESVIQHIGQKLDDTRRSLGQLIASKTAPPMPETMDIVDEVPQAPHPINERDVEDDLAKRRARLSAPPKPGGDKS